jgi:hypothetical protein
MDGRIDTHRLAQLHHRAAQIVEFKPFPALQVVEHRCLYG